jgi:hypothetical protein
MAQVRLQVLPWTEQLRFCKRHRLPVNDAWLFAGDAAPNVRASLDELAVDGSTTAEAVARLDALAASGPHALRVPGTYPHAEWQGTRLEGFVVAQGDEISEAYASEMREIVSSLGELVLHADQAVDTLRCVEQQLALPEADVLLTPHGRRQLVQHATAAVARIAPQLANLQVSPSGLPAGTCVRCIAVGKTADPRQVSLIRCDCSSCILLTTLCLCSLTLRRQMKRWAAGGNQRA